jgi:hypothetical protein
MIPLIADSAFVRFEVRLLPCKKAGEQRMAAAVKSCSRRLVGTQTFVSLSITAIAFFIWPGKVMRLGSKRFV